MHCNSSKLLFGIPQGVTAALWVLHFQFRSSYTPIKQLNGVNIRKTLRILLYELLLFFCVMLRKQDLIALVE
jgi:hypothetical protein